MVRRSSTSSLQGWDSVVSKKLKKLRQVKVYDEKCNYMNLHHYQMFAGETK